MPLPGKVFPKAGKVFPKAGSLQPAVTRRCPLGKGTAARAASWFEQLVSRNGASVSQLSPDANKAGNLFHITAALHRKQVQVAASVAAALETPTLIRKDGSLLMKLELGSAGAGRTKKISAWEKTDRTRRRGL